MTSNGESIFAYGEYFSFGQHALFEFPLNSGSTNLVGSPKSFNASEIQAINPQFTGVLIKPVGESVVVFSLVRENFSRVQADRIATTNIQLQTTV